jgi:serine/threonine protein kinase
MSNLLEGSSSKFSEVIRVTENFDDKYVIGSGAHGTVYKATMDTGEVYAIKKLVISAHSSSYKSMIRELKTLGKIRHRNLIKLKEFWLRGECGFILYDFMEHGSLYDVLHRTGTPSLDWSARYNIALGTAHGLAYLHHDSVPVIIHRDIKPSNILLNKDMVPRISDFGISKIMDQSAAAASQTTGIVGTTGYMAPGMHVTQNCTTVPFLYLLQMKQLHSCIYHPETVFQFDIQKAICHLMGFVFPCRVGIFHQKRYRDRRVQLRRCATGADHKKDGG